MSYVSGECGYFISEGRVKSGPARGWRTGFPAADEESVSPEIKRSGASPPPPHWRSAPPDKHSINISITHTHTRTHTWRIITAAGVTETFRWSFCRIRDRSLENLLLSMELMWITASLMLQIRQKREQIQQIITTDRIYTHKWDEESVTVID